MSNHHYEKWIFKTPLGFVLIAGGIIFMYYSIVFNGKERWLLYALLCGIAIALGVFLLSSAAINKVKSDMIKKQKIKQQSG